MNLSPYTLEMGHKTAPGNEIDKHISIDTCQPRERVEFQISYQRY